MACDNLRNEISLQGFICLEHLTELAKEDQLSRLLVFV